MSHNGTKAGTFLLVDEMSPIKLIQPIMTADKRLEMIIGKLLISGGFQGRFFNQSILQAKILPTWY
ncbi:hypothetical protein AS034_01870 [[Bacillus] enclensis]|nr:hypothetical protein AS034_01870 [[Bacillus] enclensis]